MSGTTRRKPGWTGMYTDSLRTWLLERGYPPGSIKQILTLAAQLGRWIQRTDVKCSQLDSAAVDSFLKSAAGAWRAAGFQAHVASDHCWTIRTAKDRWRLSWFRTRRSSSCWPSTGPDWWSSMGWRRRPYSGTRTWPAGSMTSSRLQYRRPSRRDHGLWLVAEPAGRPVPDQAAGAPLVAIAGWPGRVRPTRRPRGDGWRLLRCAVPTVPVPGGGRGRCARATRPRRPTTTAMCVRC